MSSKIPVRGGGRVGGVLLCEKCLLPVCSVFGASGDELRCYRFSCQNLDHLSVYLLTRNLWKSV